MCLLVRVEDFLVTYKKSTLWDKIANTVVGKDARAELNDDVVAALKLIFRHTDLTVDLVMDKVNYSEVIENLISDLPYGTLLKIDRPVQISTKLNTGEYMYYIDNDPVKINMIGNKRVLSLQLLNECIRGGYKFEW